MRRSGVRIPLGAPIDNHPVVVVFFSPKGIRTRKGDRRLKNSRGLFLGGRSESVAQTKDGICDQREQMRKSLWAHQRYCESSVFPLFC